MGLSETAELGVRLALTDSLTAPLNAAGQEVEGFSAAVQKTDGAVSGFGERLESARPKIREFSRAGSELSVVAAVLGNDLNATLGPLGQFIHILGDAGLVLTAIADLGPAAAKGIIALGTAQTATAGETALETTAAAASIPVIAAEGETAATAAAGFSLLTLAESAAAGAAGLLAAGVAIATAPITLLVGAGVALGVAIHEVANGFEDFHPKVGKVTTALRDEVQAALGAPEALARQSAALNGAGLSANYLSGAVNQATQDWITMRLASDATGAGLDNIAGRARFAAQAVGGLGTALNDLPTEITVDVVTRFTSSGAGAFGVGAFGGPAGNVDQPPPSSGSLPSENSLATQVANALAAANKADAAGAKAASQAKQRAAELARIYATDVTGAFNAARQAGDQFLNSQHQKSQQAINDALTLAQTNHDAAVQRINDTLNASLVSDRTPVSDAQNALSGTQNREQLRNLKEAADAAFTAVQQNTNQDPATIERLNRSLRDAREAVQNFQSQLHINDLQGKQAIADKTARDTAQKAIEVADLAYQTAKSKHDKDLAQEALEAAAKLRAFDNDVAGLEAAFLSHKSKLSTALDSITKLFQAFDINTKAPPTGGYKAPAVTVNITPTFRLTLNGREVASALATLNNPTQSGSVRSGSNS